MSLNPKLTLLLKGSAEDSDSSFVKAISSLGLETVSLPPVSFEWTNLSRLLTKLSQPELYLGLVLTSQRSVQAIAECLKLQPEKKPLIDLWRNKAVFVVGPATHKAAEQTLGLAGIGKESGNSEALAETIIENLKDNPEMSKPLLFPCSSIKQDTLPNILHSNGLSLECIECYKTRPHPEFQDMFLQLVKTKGFPSNIVFFSPSGVKSAYPVLMQSPIPIKSLKLVSMGPSTSTCLSTVGLFCSAEAATPDPSGLASALRTIQTDRCS